MRNFAARLLVAILLLNAGPAISQQSFSCPWGKEAACLDYGAKVCSQFGKCVDDDAVCFSRSTCDYKGFMCVSDHEEFADKAKQMAAGYDSFKSCVALARNMDAVQSCLRFDGIR